MAMPGGAWTIDWTQVHRWQTIWPSAGWIRQRDSPGAPGGTGLLSYPRVGSHLRELCLLIRPASHSANWCLGPEVFHVKQD